MLFQKNVDLVHGRLRIRVQWSNSTFGLQERHSLVDLCAVAPRAPFPEAPFKPDVRISRIRLTDGLLMRHARSKVS